ncbi:hypothetical protein CK203_110871 [Vitis vinifera]|uniref:Uncharacterized protein n=1 Tax=Vitis vinifera TaxID=29760 RepID=A0A438CRQ0_VITVI|nr:hypothetical protein CK203_110871 [Vitis vinifera]
MSSKKKSASSARVSNAHEKSTDKLSVKEFRDRFCIPNGVIVEFLHGEDVVSTEKVEQDTIIFSKEQFNVGLRFPLPALLMEFLHFTKIPPVFIHPNIIRVLMGCSIINMLYNLDLTMLEVFFVYSLKKAKTDIFSLYAHLPSLQLVTELPDLTKGGAKGRVMVRGAWAGSRHPARPFSPNYSLKIPGAEKRGHLVDWVEKASFDCLSKLFEIDAKERQCKTLLTARNLTAVVREPQEYVTNILPRKMPKEVVPGEHYIVKDLSIYEASKEADAEKRRVVLEDREKKKNEGTLRKAPGQKRGADSPPKKTPAKRRKLVKKNGKDVKEPTPPKEFAHPPIVHEAEVMIEEPVNPAPHSISSGSGHLAGLNHSSTSLAAVGRLANLAEEAASVNHPDSRNPDADAAEAVCATPMEEAGAESQSQPSDDPDRLALVLVTGPPSKKPRSVRNLRSGLLGRLQERQQEIEVSCSSAHDAHPEGGEVEMVTETPAVPVVVLAELEDKLKEIPPGSPDIMPSAQMFEKVETLVSGLRGMAQQHDLFADLLRTTDYMKIFASRHKESENQLRLKLEEAEASLSTIRKENEALRVDLAEAKSREESTADRLHEAADEMTQLRGEELEREFAAEREELEAEYKKQVDDTFIFGYRCCMKKNGIKRDVPSIPPGEEKKLHDKPAP